MKTFVPFIGILALLLLGCQRETFYSGEYDADPKVVGESKYPVAVDPAKVGGYEAFTQSGGGYFCDEVLEYRVWLCPARGAKDLDEGNDYFVSFAQYERAAEFAKAHAGSEEPLALVRQREWIDEPEPGKYLPMKEERRSGKEVTDLEDRDASGGNLRQGHD